MDNCHAIASRQNPLNSKKSCFGAAALSFLDYIIVAIISGDLAYEAYQQALISGIDQVFQNPVIYTFVKLCESFSYIFPAGSPYSFFIIWFALFLLRLYSPCGQVRVNLYDRIFCLILSIFLVFANSFSHTDSFSVIISSPYQLFLSAVTVLLQYILFINLAVWLKHLFSKFSAHSTSLPQLWERHPFLFPLLVIMAAWLPLAIMRYPGTFEWDAYQQIREILGEIPLTGHWPVASTAFLGYSFIIFRAIFGTNNGGLFGTVLLQMLICASCLAYSLYTMKRIGVKKPYLLAALLIYALATIFSRYLTSIVKDSIFSCLVVLFLSVLIQLHFGICGGKKAFLCLFASAFLMSVFRNNGIYIVIFCLGFLLVSGIIRIVRKQEKLPRPPFVALLLTIMLYFVYQNVFLPALSIPPGSIKEALSVPFQQTARYVRAYPDEVTDDEREAIDAVLDYDSLAESYDPRLSDPVKTNYHGDSASLIQYFKVWLKQFFKHPDIYISATFNNSFQFFYPPAVERRYGLYLENNLMLAEDSQLQFDSPSIYYNFTSWFINIYITAFENCPLFYPICNCGIQFWICIYLCLYALFRRRELLLLLVPSIVGMLVCIASPTFTHNGIRYALPVIYANPMLISIILGTSKSSSAA